MADADPVGGTLVFRADDRTVVTEASGARRDARSTPEREPATAGSGGKRRTSAFDLPPSEPRKDDGGELVN